MSTRTFLTLNHAHTALFGAFGLLGIGLIYFCLRYIAGDAHRFGERLGRWAFWLYNGGLVHVDRVQLLPDRLAAAGRGLRARPRLCAQQAFYDTTLFWQWMRMPGDVVFALGALLMAWDFIVKLRPLLPGFVGIFMPVPRPLPGAPQARNEHRRQSMRRARRQHASFPDPRLPAVLSGGRALVGDGDRAVDRHVHHGNRFAQPVRSA